MTGDIYVLDLGRTAPVPCGCGTVSLFVADLIPMDYLVSKSHLPASRCHCGRWYYSWSRKAAFEAKDSPR